jgi:hypothetical protein
MTRTDASFRIFGDFRDRFSDRRAYALLIVRLTGMASVIPKQTAYTAVDF